MQLVEAVAYAAAQMLTNGGSTALEPPYNLFISSSQYTGQMSAWNWESTYQGGGTLGGSITSVRPNHLRVTGRSQTRQGAFPA